MAFMPFVTAGDPELVTSLALIRELTNQGADLIEVGFPYSDPIADGPVIQAAYTRALESGLRVCDIFAAVKSLHDNRRSTTQNAEPCPPFIAMVSYSIVFRIGTETFVKQAKDACFSGLIIPDLPGDEADEFAELVRSQGLNLIPLVAPTTTPERAQRILQKASGFVYCISVAGTTGVRDHLPSELKGQLTWLRDHTDLPLAVGFGINNPEQVDALRGLADGIIVGSAIVRQMMPVGEEPQKSEAAIADVGRFAARMVEATHS